MRLRNIALRNIFRNRRRSILSALAIAIAAMSITLLFSFLGGFSADIFATTQSLVGEARVRNREFEAYEHLNPTHLVVDNAGELTARIEALPETSVVVPRIEFPTAIFLDGEEFRATGNGVDFQREIAFQGIDDYVVAGRLPEAGQAEALVGYLLAEELELEIGDRFTSLVTTRTRASNAFSVEIVGLFQSPMSALSRDLYYIPLDRAQHYLRMGDAVQSILAKSERPNRSAALAASIQGSLGSDSPLEVLPWEAIGTIYSLIQRAQFTYAIIAVVFFILGSSVIINTTMMVIFERVREIGTLGAMGMRGGELVRLFLLEALFIAMVGSAAGVGLGALINIPLSIFGFDLSSQVGDTGLDLSDIIYTRLTLNSTLFVFIYSTVIAGLASLIPSLRTARIQPVEALRST